MDRIELLNKIRTGRSQLESALAAVAPGQVEEVVLHGDWSVKDLLGHLYFWERRVQNIFRILAEGGDPEGVSPDTGLNALNRQAYEANHNRSFTDVRQDEGQAFQGLLKLVETASETELFNPGHFSWTGGRPFADLILDNSAGHYEEHIPELKTWLGQKH